MLKPTDIVFDANILYEEYQNNIAVKELIPQSIYSNLKVSSLLSHEDGNDSYLYEPNKFKEYTKPTEIYTGYTKKILDTLKTELPDMCRARYWVGGKFTGIRYHKDNEGMTTYFIPIKNPIGFKFLFEISPDTFISYNKLEEGRLYKFKSTCYHFTVNFSEQERVHLNFLSSYDKNSFKI